MQELTEAQMAVLQQNRPCCLIRRFRCSMMLSLKHMATLQPGCPVVPTYAADRTLGNWLYTYRQC